MPKYRDVLLENALRDLTADSNVLAVYQSGSLAKGNFDHYSDIDLHIIVTPEKKEAFINDKRNRATKWGEVLFYEGTDHSQLSLLIMIVLLKWIPGIKRLKRLSRRSG
ncbi:nucleotidyltransferase domain-containing protein [Scopulibacillus darangshiensis]|uniref:nucleotidyltransferase domain-containing protein n=1 Tax=Scopulibacillus darangshiensis TaxID=442528 RepID=UPI001FB3CCC1|nr:nucleotidyltransferase domain-containing protein [Scopulibacillus darangshiensis]